MLFLDGLLVLDFSQYLSGPSAAMRLADFGARVVKIESPNGGDNGRTLAVSNMFSDGDSVNFQAINRGKESITANLKDANDLKRIKKLVSKADVLIENFRPGVMKKLGLDYESVSAINKRLVYTTITGYGSEGPWKNKPGQDLLVQSMSGLEYLNGNADMPPTPFGVSIADTITGKHAVEGILACLIRRIKTGKGGRVEVSLLESTLYLQLEALTTYLNNQKKLPSRSLINNAHADVCAPYGIYETSDGFIAVSFGSIGVLGEILGCDELLDYADESCWFKKRDEIKTILCKHLKHKTSEEWLKALRKANYWSSECLNWKELVNSDWFKYQNPIQTIERAEGPNLKTTVCPIRLNGKKLVNTKGAPRLGEDNIAVNTDFRLLTGEKANETA